MSFSQLSKEELAQIPLKNDDEQRIELAAIIRLSGAIKMTSSGLVVEIKLMNGMVAKRVYEHIKNLYQHSPQIGVRARQKVEKSNTYVIRITQDVDLILENLGISDGLLKLSNNIPKTAFSTQGTKQAYIRGLYLSRGAIVDPKKSYGMELVIPSEILADEIIALFADFGILAKKVERNKGVVVYNHRADDIFSILNLIGARQSSFAFMEIKMLKEMRNDANRQSNCDIANSIKTSEAAQKQINQIQILERNDKMRLLTEKDQMIAKMRCEYPEYSLAIIAEELNKAGLKISKSGVNHAIRRIAQLAEKYENR